MRKTLISASVLLAVAPATANIVGTDYQNFNPTTSGLDFVTVHSSETLKPYIINMGIFSNYAANSLTYSETLNANVQKGQKRKDRILGVDLSLGMGLTERWDFGINIPIVADRSVEDDYYVSSFDQNGITEVKANTKFRFLGDDTGGVAGIVSVNKNLIEDNPFSGRAPGLTWNFELAADTTLRNNWAFGANVGYRKRNPGTAIPGVAFVPMEDQWIYSMAGSYLVAAIDTKLILELYGSRPVDRIDQDTDRGLNSLEALAGLKHDLSRNLAMHLGYTRQVDASLGGPEWRIYGGLNFALGPIYQKPESPVVQTASVAPVAPSAGADEESAAAPQGPQVFKLDVELLFGYDSDGIDTNQIAAFDPFFSELTAGGFQRLVIEGHTDSIGPAAYNLHLSQRRAEAVRKHLIETYKIPADKVEAVGMGQAHPVADNGNYQGRRKNRRVELKVWK